MKNKTKSKIRMKVLISLVAFICLINLTAAINWDDVQSYWTLNETSGTNILELVTGKHNATAYNTPTLGNAGVIGTGILFDKNTFEYLNVTQSSDFHCLTNCSINFWTKPEDYSAGAPANFINFWDTPNKGFSVYGKLGFIAATIGDSSITHNEHITGRYVMISLINNGTDALLYINGSKVNSTIINSIAPQSLYGLGFAYGGAGGEYYAGSLDEVSFWGKALSNEDILGLYNNGNGLEYGISTAEELLAINQPTNNSIFSSAGKNFSISYLNLTENDYTWINSTISIWKSGIVYDISNYTYLSNLSGTSNETEEYIDAFVFGVYEWNVEAWYGNATFVNFTDLRSNYTFTTRQIQLGFVNVLGENIYPSCSVLYGTLTEDYLYTESEGHTTDTINCSLSGYLFFSTEYDTSDGDKTFTMETINYYFRFINDVSTLINTNFTIIDINTTQSFETNELIIAQTNFSYGLVQINFNYNPTTPEENLSQSYEFINAIGTTINESLYVLDDVDGTLNVYIKDVDNKLIPNAVVRMSCAVATTSRTNMLLINQKITNGDGHAVLNFQRYKTNSEYNCKVEVVAEGYDSDYKLITSINQNQDIVFKLKTTTSDIYKNIWLVLSPKNYDANTTKIYGAYYWTLGQEVQVTTSYRTATGLSRKAPIANTKVSDTYSFRLDAGIDWDNTLTNDIVIETWLKEGETWNNVRNDTITYLEEIRVMEIQKWATSQWAITIYFIFLILISGAISWATNSSTAGVQIFMMGLVVNTLILSGWKANVITGVGIYYFMLLLLKRLNKE